MNENFTIIYKQLAPDIYKLIFSYTLNTSDTKDILQNVFIKYYKNYKRYPNDIVQIKRILIRIASNLSKNFLTSKWHSKTLLIDDVSKYQFNDNETRMVAELSKIPHQYRIVLYLFYYEGYKTSEISEILKISDSTVKQRLKRAREKLKKEMER